MFTARFSTHNANQSTSPKEAEELAIVDESLSVVPRLSSNAPAHSCQISEMLEPGHNDCIEVTISFSDLEHPHRLSHARKWTIVLLLCTVTVNMGYTSAVFSPAFSAVAEEFSCSRLISTLGLSLFIAGLGMGPLLFAPLSEFYGRKPIYVVSLLLYFIWLFPCAFAPSFEVLLVSRFLDGVSGSAFVTVAGGTVGDLFEKKDISGPMLVFTASPFWGAGLGPILVNLLHRRWVFYHLLIWAAVQLVVIAVLVPETYHPVITRSKAKRLRLQLNDKRYKARIEVLERSLFQTILRSVYRPFTILFLEPMCFILCIYTAIVLGIQYLFFGAFRIVYSDVYGFHAWQVALTFIGMLLGMTAAVATGQLGIWNYRRLVTKREREEKYYEGPEPEYRLPPAIVGAPFITVGLFWFAWTISILVYSGIFTFFVDAYPLYTASALGANSFTRSMFAAGFPLFGVQMYDRLGYKWASSLLAFLSLAMLPFPTWDSSLDAPNHETWTQLRKDTITIGDTPLTFEALKSLHSFRHVLYKTLRLQGPAGRVQRLALRDTVLPHGGGHDGKSAVLVRKGDVVALNL
ncbi:MFS transporter protein [Rutstroemia sp. NJR-2017a BBW]|nr:MFS transporter protein [Rutstroemia sp. NJR-2017a BBW]